MWLGERPATAQKRAVHGEGRRRVGGGGGEVGQARAQCFGEDDGLKGGPRLVETLRGAVDQRRGGVLAQFLPYCIQLFRVEGGG